MHATAWRALRATHQLDRRSACRIVAGVRRPRVRNFHPSAAANRAPEEPAGAASEKKDDSNKPEAVKGQTCPEGEAADGAENITQSNDVAQRSGRRQSYGSGIRRTSRNKAATGLPPLVFPEWFWERNVTCYGEPEDVTQRVDIKYALGGIKEYKPTENALLSLNPDNIPVLNRQAVKKLEMEIHITETLRKELVSLLERLEETKGKAQELESTIEWKEAYADQPLEITCSEEAIEKSVLLLRYVAPMRGLLAIAQSNDASNLKNPRYWYSLSEKVYHEIYTSFYGELKLHPPKINIKDVHKQDTLLLCPTDGGLNFLSAVVQKVATVLEADVIRLDSEDIAQIVGGYLGEDAVWTKNPIALLGYGSSGRLDGLESSDKKEPMDDDVDADDSFENEDNHSPFFPPEFTARGKGPPSHATIAFLQTPSKLLQGQKLSKSMNLVNFLGQSAISSSFAAQSANPGESWNDYKMARAMEEIIGAADVKRARSVAGPAEDQQFLKYPAVLASKGLIIEISGYKELNEHPVGYNILKSLREAVKKRWYNGRSIMIVGTAAESVERTSVQARNSLGDRFSSEFAFGGPRTIFVPPECRPARIADDQKAQIMDLNIRHVEHMIRRLLGAENESRWKIDLNQDIPEDCKMEEISIGQVVWSYNTVRRIATTILGTAGLDRLLDGNNLRQALVLLRASDGTKLKWARREDLLRGAVKSMDAAKVDGNSSPVEKADMEKEDKLDKLKKQCTAYEKKLLGGVINPADIHTTFADVRAPPETIEALKTLTSLSLIRPDSFSYGVLATDKIPGLLLYGPPGTGKTLLAKAVAKESGATMLEVSASEINDMYVGEGEKNVKALFSLAKKLSPCVVFIDEADSLFGSRGDRFQRKSHREIINQFLREWDGMANLSAFIMVATNRPFDLDEAVLRRLPRRLLIDLPVEKDREAILRIHLKDEIVDESISLATLAKNTPFYSGSDLKNLSVAAALACVREENEVAAKHTGEEPYVYPVKRILRKEHFDKAMEEISASISEDMSTLSAIRKFDERYGDRKGRRKKKSGLGFGGTTDPEPDSEAGRVRKLQLNM
jgi:SpoVK/Ycf46/Vps4 family AAA+-type ATPase